mgnify:CR=1 FL=1
MEMSDLKTKLKYILTKDMLLVFILLLVSSGSYTFSGSVNSKTKPVDNKRLFFNDERSYDFFAVFPYEVILLRQKRAIEKCIVVTPSSKIYHTGVFSIQKMANYLKLNNPKLKDEHSLKMAELYLEESFKEGINHDVAFSQMCLETGFLKFGGDVDATQNNFCGLGVTGGGVKGLEFDDMRSGIRAHIQHLKAYGSTEDLNMDLIDKRFHYVKRGSAPVVDDLTGKWATDKNYGDKISNIISRIDKFQQ